MARLIAHFIRPRRVVLGGLSLASVAVFLTASLLLAGHGRAAEPNPMDTPPVRPRASLLPLVGPLWSALTPAQRTVLAPFEPQWNAWSIEEKRAWVVVANRYPSMKDAQQESLRTRINEWASLTPEQRRMARQNYRIVRTMPPEERAEEVRRYQELTPEQRQVLETNGWTSNTAARHAGSRTGLAKQASQPISDVRPAATH